MSCSCYLVHGQTKYSKFHWWEPTLWLSEDSTLNWWIIKKSYQLLSISKGKVGLAKDFKARFSKHKASIATPTPKNSTTLSTHFLNQQAAGLNPKLSWRFLKTNLPTFNPVTNKCILCISEKFHILYKSELATLNSRSEIFSACRHKKAELLVPPDPKSQGG